MDSRPVRALIGEQVMEARQPTSSQFGTPARIAFVVVAALIAVLVPDEGASASGPYALDGHVARMEFTMGSAVLEQAIRANCLTRADVVVVPMDKDDVTLTAMCYWAMSP